MVPFRNFLNWRYHWEIRLPPSLDQQIQLVNVGSGDILFGLEINFRSQLVFELRDIREFTFISKEGLMLYQAKTKGEEFSLPLLRLFS